MTTPPQATVSPIAGYLSLVSVLVFLVLLVVLHFLEPEFNPPHLISEYQLGRFGWLMSLAFVCLGAGSLFLSRALWPDLLTRGGRFGRSLLLLIGIAYFGAGIFTPNPASIIEGRLHGVFGLVVIFGSPIAFTLLSRSLVYDLRWSAASHRLSGVTLLAWLGLLSFCVSIVIFYGFYGAVHAYGTVVVGWTNRFMIAAYCTWLMVMATQATKISRQA